jgi:hypothetical protein
MSFTFDAPWAKGLGAVPNIVTRYQGHAVDAKVTRKQARAGKHAEGCWAGTPTSGLLQLDFAVSRVKVKTVDGKPGLAPLVYATHTMSSWKPMVKTFKGMIGNQDAFYCERPKTTKVTFQAPGCDGCEIQVMNGAFRPENTWSTDSREVSSGEVSFRVPRPLTKGISATVVAPWEGATGYTTLVAFRYAGHLHRRARRATRLALLGWQPGEARDGGADHAPGHRPRDDRAGRRHDRLRPGDPALAEADAARPQGGPRLAGGHRLPEVGGRQCPRWSRDGRRATGSTDDGSGDATSS